MPHPSFESLLNYVDGSLPQDTRASIESHLNGPCARCQLRVRRLTQLLQQMAADTTVTPPSHVLNRMLAVVRRLAPNRPRLPAQLVFDSWQHAPLAAMRGASQAQQLLFTAEGLDIDLQVSQGPASATVRGQILGNEPADAQPTAMVVLQAGKEVVATAEPDRLGQFVFRSIPAGTYEIHIEYEQNDIAIDGLHLGQ